MRSAASLIVPLVIGLCFLPVISGCSTGLQTGDLDLIDDGTADCDEGLACDDGDACTVGETCQNGVCGGGVPPNCVDSACDPAGEEGNCDADAPVNPPLPGQGTTIEPDDFEDGTDLTDINPNVTLWTTGDDNEPIPLFFVSASDDNAGYAPTGDRVFGHANIPFFNTHRRLRMDFTAPVRSVSIDFAGGSFSVGEIGRLEVYNAADVLLAEYVSAPREGGETETMTITRGTADIAWAIAYIAENEGSFGRLDQLSFSP